jgi:hypothetical protein
VSRRAWLGPEYIRGPGMCIMSGQRILWVTRWLIVEPMPIQPRWRIAFGMVSGAVKAVLVTGCDGVTVCEALEGVGRTH